MATEKQQKANTRNAKKSTGPQTESGKAIVARNAVKHGGFSAVPVIPDFERAEDWEEHRLGILKSLSPSGRLESILAERISLLLWRLDRVTRYETNIIGILMAEAVEPVLLESLDYFDKRAEEEKPENVLPKVEEELAETNTSLQDYELALGTLRQLREGSLQDPVSPDATYLILSAANEWVEENRTNSAKGYLPAVEEEGFLMEIGIPKGDSFVDVTWTTELLVRGLNHLTGLAQVASVRLIEVTERELDKERDRLSSEVTEQKSKAKKLRQQAQTARYRKKARRSLPLPETETRIMRCESHLNRQLFQTLHELQRLQAARAGEAVPVPGALEIGVNISEDSE